MMMALAAMRDLPCVLVPGGVTLPPTEGEDAGKVQIDRRPLRARRDHARRSGRVAAAARAHRPAAAASFSARRPRRKSSAKRWACRCRTRRWRPAASRSGSTWPAAARRRSMALAERGIKMARHSHRRGDAQRDGRPRRLRRLDESAACTFRPSRIAAGLRRPTVDDWTDINRRVPRFVDALAQRPGRPSDGARLPRRRRAGSHAALCAS